MTDLEKRAMGRTPFTRDQLEDRYEGCDNRIVQALCESHMRVLMDREELLAACEVALAGYLEYVGEDVESIELKTDEEIADTLRKAIANAKGVTP
jgi:hypothetical protein